MRFLAFVLWLVFLFALALTLSARRAAGWPSSDGPRTVYTQSEAHYLTERSPDDRY